MKKSYREFPPGELNTPWDIAYRKSPLVRYDEVFKEMATLEHGVTYFIEAIEKMDGKTYFSCEGHPENFYILFAMPYVKARILSKFLMSGFIEVSNSVGIENEELWKLALRPHGDAVHLAVLRELSNGFQSCLTFMKKESII